MLSPAIFFSSDCKGVSFLLYPASVRAIRIFFEAMEELPVYLLSPRLSLQDFGEQVKGEKNRGRIRARSNCRKDWERKLEGVLGEGKQWG